MREREAHFLLRPRFIISFNPIGALFDEAKKGKGEREMLLLQNVITYNCSRLCKYMTRMNKINFYHGVIYHPVYKKLKANGKLYIESKNKYPKSGDNKFMV